MIKQLSLSSTGLMLIYCLHGCCTPYIPPGYFLEGKIVDSSDSVAGEVVAASVTAANGTAFELQPAEGAGPGEFLWSGATDDLGLYCGSDLLSFNVPDTSPPTPVQARIVIRPPNLDERTIVIDIDESMMSPDEGGLYIQIQLGTITIED